MPSAKTQIPEGLHIRGEPREEGKKKEKERKRKKRKRKEKEWIKLKEPS